MDRRVRDAPVIIMPVPLYHHIEEIGAARRIPGALRRVRASQPRVTVHDPLPAFHARAARRAASVPLRARRAPDARRRIACSRNRWPTSLRSARRAAAAAANVTTVLGISALYHDAAAAIVRDGEIVAAAQEERFTRKKHDPRFPAHAINYCLEEAFIDAVRAASGRVLRQSGADARSRAADRSPASRRAARSSGNRPPGRCSATSCIVARSRARSRWSGCAGAVHASTTLLARRLRLLSVAVRSGGHPHARRRRRMGDDDDRPRRRDRRSQLLKAIDYPHSLGLLYSAFTYFCGFKVNSGEYKLMGLAPYGEPHLCGRHPRAS